MKYLPQQVRRLEITTRGLVEDLAAGDYASAFRGRGVEFEEVREYFPGDDVRTIDWNVTARLGNPHVKRFREERQLTLLLLVDISASGHFGSGTRTKRELAAELAAVLTLSATRHRDRIGALLYSDRVEWFTPPRSGRSQALAIMDRVLGHEPVGRGTDLVRALEYLDPLLRRRVVIGVISDFLDPDQWQALERLAPRHDAIAFRVTDPREALLPDIGLATLTDPETGRWRVVDLADRTVRAALQSGWTDLERRFEARCRTRGIDLVNLATDRPYAETLMGFFRRRARVG